MQKDTHKISYTLEKDIPLEIEVTFAFMVWGSVIESVEIVEVLPHGTILDEDDSENLMTYFWEECAEGILYDRVIDAGDAQYHQMKDDRMMFEGD